MDDNIEGTDIDVKSKIEITYDCTTLQKKIENPNCNERNINNITYFLAHYLSKLIIDLPDNIQKNLRHHHIKNGKIFGYGGYGFIFGFHDINEFVMKICLCNTDDQKKLNNFEIQINKIVSEYGNESYIKIYGIINFDCINKKTQIVYTNLIKNTISNIDINKNNCDNIPCEKYLIIEKGYKDLFDIMSDILEKKRPEYNLDIILNNYFELFTSYKISKNILKYMNKIFINNDIKIENIMAMNNQSDTKFKLIDFGLSLLSDNFFYKNPNPFENFRGTKIFIELLYNKSVRELLYNPKIIEGTLSPLYDLFCLHCTFIHLYTVNSNYPTYNNMFLTVFNKYIFISDKIQKNNIAKILVIGLVIKNFYMKNMIDKNIEKLIINKNDNLLSYYIKFNTLNNIPTYIKTGNKLLDDYIYFDKIIQFILTCDDIILSNKPIILKYESELDPASITYAFY